MKVPACRIHSVGEITSWAKGFLEGLQKENLVDVAFDKQVDAFIGAASPHVAVVFIENTPDMRQLIAKLRQSGRSLILVWYGKLFTKEDLAFAQEQRVYWVLENPRPEDKKVQDGIRHVAQAAERVQQHDQHLHSLKALL